MNHSNHPREIRARFQCRCNETGSLIKKGQTCIFYPVSHKVYHPNSWQAGRFYEEEAKRQAVIEEKKKQSAISQQLSVFTNNQHPESRNQQPV